MAILETGLFKLGEDGKDNRWNNVHLRPGDIVKLGPTLPDWLTNYRSQQSSSLGGIAREVVAFEVSDPAADRSFTGAARQLESLHLVESRINHSP